MVVHFRALSRSLIVCGALAASHCGSGESTSAPGDAGAPDTTGAAPDGSPDAALPTNDVAIDADPLCVHVSGHTPGSPDTGFGEQSGTGNYTWLDDVGDGGIRPTSVALIVMPSGKIMMAGYDARGWIVFRLSEDGILDSSFGANGISRIAVGTGGYISAIAADGEDRLLIAGTNLLDAVVARLDANGLIDKTFGADGLAVSDFGTTNDRFVTIAVRNDGSIVAGGLKDANGAGTATMLAYFDKDGHAVTSAGSAGVVTLHPSDGRWLLADMSPQSDQSLLLFGLAQGSRLFWAQVDARGALVPSFGQDGYLFAMPSPLPRPVGFAPNSDGTMFAWAQTGQAAMTGFDRAALPARTTMPINMQVQAVASQCDGGVLVGGVQNVGSTATGAFRRVGPSGALDPAFGSGGVVLWTASAAQASRFSAVAILRDKRILVAGDDAQRMFVARYWP